MRFGNDVVGGTRISHLSHIDKARKVPLIVKRGKSATFTVQPLKEAPRPVMVTDEQITDLVALMGTKGVAPGDLLAIAATAINRPIGHPRELTVDEYATVVDRLTEREDAEGDA